MNHDPNLPVDFIDEDEVTEEEFEKILEESEEFDDSDAVKEQ